MQPVDTCTLIAYRKSMLSKTGRLALLTAFSLALGAGCEDDHGHGHDHETEVITTIELTFTPDGGAEPIVAKFQDLDGDGGESGTSDPIDLLAGSTYTLTIRFLNESDEPVEDITEEVEAEAEEHMIFFGGDAPVMHAYADTEADYGDNAVDEDLPVGLANTITTDAAGTGSFRVMLRHLPELNGEPQKTADLAQAFADGETLPGDVDADVSFELTVE
jgi:hypothetical protein